MARVLVRPKARRDLISILAYYIENAGIEVARRFRAAATDTFNLLAATPLMGAPGKVRNSRFHGVRMWQIQGFENYLVFYVPRRNGIAVERVIHAARDYQRIL